MRRRIIREDGFGTDDPYNPLAGTSIGWHFQDRYLILAASVNTSLDSSPPHRANADLAYTARTENDSPYYSPTSDVDMDEAAAATESTIQDVDFGLAVGSLALSAAIQCLLFVLLWKEVRVASLLPPCERNRGSPLAVLLILLACSGIIFICLCASVVVFFAAWESRPRPVQTHLSLAILELVSVLSVQLAIGKAWVIFCIMCARSLLNNPVYSAVVAFGLLYASHIAIGVVLLTRPEIRIGKKPLYEAILWSSGALIYVAAAAIASLYYWKLSLAPKNKQRLAFLTLVR
ncbi:hypothetical protein B0T26DRAFT_756931 [Lasiosphaeria miniovina]|uniref:Uncharacterized protein n=1 Tax=Lasiosphaeria miniovina TaxID=1954250 RepID=A0AA39ZTI6_9PEZI|nr:uncharacterized protein B0T26DRAFT_756931 [Lasiosphaeria miniovina]KAK0703367.1 hypothetical protein B0T26DRAFT_756931 [Lasiosphaeria miniovina]